MKKCQICEKGNLIQVEDIILPVEEYVFVVKGERCSNCHEGFPFEEETQKTIETARKLGVWPEPMKLYRHLSKKRRWFNIHDTHRFRKAI
jgi:hypothetical protein